MNGPGISSNTLTFSFAGRSADRKAPCRLEFEGVDMLGADEVEVR